MAVLRGGMVALIGVVTGVGTLIVLFVGGGYVIEGRIGFGDFVAFNAYLGLLAWPTIALGWIINTFQRGAGAMQRLDEVLRGAADGAAGAGRGAGGPGTAEARAGRRRHRDPRPDLRLRGAVGGRGAGRPRPGAARRESDASRGAAASRWSGRSARASRRWPACWPGSTRRRRARSSSAARTSTRSRSPGCGAASATCRRRRSCSRARCARTSLFGRPEAGEDEIWRAVEMSHLAGTWRRSPRGWTRWSASAASRSPAGSASAPRWPARWSATRGS